MSILARVHCFVPRKLDPNILTTLCLERSRAAPLKIWLDMNQVKRQPRFSDLIIPRIQSATSLEFSEFMTPEDLMKTLPDFPQSMPNLQSLDVSLSVHAPNWNPSINPFNPFPHTLKCLLLYDIPLCPPILNLRTLTKLLLHNFNFNHSLDTLLTFLEENCSLVDVILRIDSSDPILHRSPRRAPIKNQLQHLSVTSYDSRNIRALISSIPLRKGSDLEINSRGLETGVNDIFSSTARVANLQSPTYMCSCEGVLQLSGPNGGFSFSGPS